jgi:endonuclease/exonuclease/phosphatase family metal-dependent hydrolase
MENIKLDKCDLMLLGDFNANMLLHSKNKEKKELLKFMRVFDLTQLITDATRVTETTRTLVDVILVNNDHRITDSGVVSVSLSDHYLVYCVLKSGITKAQPKTIEYRSSSQ